MFSIVFRKGMVANQEAKVQMPPTKMKLLYVTGVDGPPELENPLLPPVIENPVEEIPPLLMIPGVVVITPEELTVKVALLF
jgi:hypothetical protein